MRDRHVVIERAAAEFEIVGEWPGRIVDVGITAAGAPFAVRTGRPFRITDRPRGAVALQFLVGCAIGVLVAHAVAVGLVAQGGSLDVVVVTSKV